VHIHPGIQAGRRGELHPQGMSRAHVAAWIEEYNRDSRHSARGMRSPIDYEHALCASEQGPAAWAQLAPTRPRA
jgi:transposase InsO family protein